jgi:putative glutamine amidotransferase
MWRLVTDPSPRGNTAETGGIYGAVGMKPRVGITTSPGVHEDRWVEALERAYITAVVEAGAVPFVLPTLDPSEVTAVLPCLDGLLLAGGGDVDPARYGAEPTDTLVGVDAGRDAYELALVEAAVTLGVPVLGICRGAQVLNVARHGTLVAHLPAVTSLPHRVEERWGDVAHPVRVDSDSVLAGVVGAEALGVNTLHHQAVDVVGVDLRAVAWAEDGVVEAIEGRGPVRLLGVQWHPELLPADPRHRALFRWLVDEAARPHHVPALPVAAA